MPEETDDNVEQQAQTQSNVDVNASSAFRLNPPNMNSANIDSYFMSLEFGFAASGIKADQQMYNIIMAQVPPQKLSELRGIVDARLHKGKYKYIKNKLLEHFADSQQRRLQKVLSDMPLGDMNPSQLLNEMRRVAGSALGDSVLLDLWAARLPAHAQAAVIASKGDATDRATIADAIVDSLGFRNVNAVEKATTPHANIDLINLQKQISQLTQQVNQLLSNKAADQTTHCCRSRSHSSSRWNFNNSNNNNNNNNDIICWYHCMYGTKARTCRKPCNFASSDTNINNNKL